jgi:hypothetical protein
MKKYHLTLNAEEFKRIYNLDESTKKLKSIKLYWPLALAALSLAAGILRLIEMTDDKSEVLTLLIIFGIAVYMLDKFWRDRKAIVSRIKNIEAFITKNEAFESTTVSVDDHHFILEQDNEYSKMNMEEVNAIKVHEDHATLAFKEASFIIPKGAFVSGEWDEFIEDIKRFS